MVVLISSLVPGLILLIAIISLLTIVVVVLKKRLTRLKSNTDKQEEDIADYASTPIVSVHFLDQSCIPPPLPKTPRPSLETSVNECYISSHYSAVKAVEDGSNTMERVSAASKNASKEGGVYWNSGLEPTTSTDPALVYSSIETECK